MPCSLQVVISIGFIIWAVLVLQVGNGFHAGNGPMARNFDRTGQVEVK